MNAHHHIDHGSTPRQQCLLIVIALVIGVVFVVLLLWLERSYAQNTTVGGAFAAGGKPSAAIVQGAPSCGQLTNVNSISVNAVAAGSSRMLLAIVQRNGSPTVSSIGTGSQSFTSVGNVNLSDLVQVDIWRLTSPTLGSQTVTAQLSGVVGAINICVLAFENVTGTQNFASTSGTTGPAALSTSSAVGNMAIIGFASANNFISPFDSTYLFDVQVGGIVFAFVGKAPGASTVNVSYSLSGSNAWVMAMLDIIKVP